MEPNPVSEELPAIYRAILDCVAEIAASGRRPLANAVRLEAIGIYSRAWDDRARRDLEALLRRHTAEPVGTRQSGRGLRRRPVRAA